MHDIEDDIKKADKGTLLVRDTILGLIILATAFLLMNLILGFPSILWALAPIWLPIALILFAVFGLGLFYLTLIIIYNVAEWLKNISKHGKD